MWSATVLTLFPDMFPGPLAISLAGKALAAKLWALDAIDIRASASDRHRTVDDTPAGGGPGMVMKPDVLARAIDSVPALGRPRLLMSPRGKPLSQARVEALARGPGAILVCGRFEGVDERVIAGRDLEEISLGDYVLSGGEVAALALLDACVRLIPGVVGAEASIAEESFAGGLLEYPAVYEATGVRRPPDSRCAAVRRPRQGGGLATRRGGTDHPRTAARSVASLRGAAAKKPVTTG